MNEIIQPGAGVIFMKVGTHAQEDLKSIIARKREEYDKVGSVFWGYGGNTCHPTHLVQPFAKEMEIKGQAVHLVMSRIDSKHFAEPELASEYSDDGIDWKPIPEGIQVKGSRYAIILDDLHVADFDLNLQHTRVAVGPSRGREGSAYIQGQVDKGCFVISEPIQGGAAEGLSHINLYAALQPPYAVFLR